MGVGEEVSLPRGGVRRPATATQKINLAKDDLFKSDGGSLPKKQRRRRQRKSPKGEEKDRTSVVIEALTVHNLTEGMVVLGCVQQVLDFGLRVSLPGAILGNVDITQVSHAYSRLLRQFAQGVQEHDAEVLQLSRMFHEGQTVVCKVLSVSPEELGSTKMAVSLSLDPASVNSSLLPSMLRDGMVLQAAVSSIEDHGYVMDCGVDGVEGFLPQTEAAQFLKKCNKGQALGVGQLILCAITSKAKEGRVLQLTARPSAVNSVSTSEDFTLHSMLPGLKTELTVTETQDEGLVVTWQGLEGCVHRSHLSNLWDFPRDYTPGQTLIGILLYIQPLIQLPYFSLKGPVTKPQQLFGGLHVGALVEEAAVVAVDPGSVHLRLGPSGVRGLCPKAHVSDQDVEDARDFCSVDEHCRCRIIALSYMDRVAVVSMKKSILHGSFVSPDALVPGTKFEGTVKQVVSSGLVVSLSPWVQGFVQTLHVSDHPDRRPEPGASVRCRLLRADHGTDPPKLWLTCRRALLSSRRPIVSSYEEAVSGMVTDGIVVQVTSKGLLVSLYNNVKGWVPLRELTCPAANVEDQYFPGKIVSCRVVNCQAGEERLTLSLKLSPKEADIKGGKIDQASTDHSVPGVLEMGMVLSGTLEAKQECGFLVKLSSGASASLSQEHLSDFAPHCTHLHKLLPEGAKLDNLMVFSTVGGVTLSRKASLVSAARKGLLIKRLEDAQPGTLVYGVLKAFVRHGILLELPAGIKGFVSLKNVADEFLREPSMSGFLVGQCLAARVLEVDLERRQLRLSTSMKSCGTSLDKSSMEVLRTHLNDENLLSSLDKSESKLPKKLSLVKVIVKSIDTASDTVFCKTVKSSIEAVATMLSVSGVIPKVGSILEAVVVGCEPELSRIELCIDPQAAKALKAPRQKEISLRTLHSGKVLCQRPEYGVILLRSGHLCLVPMRNHINATCLLPLVNGSQVQVWAWEFCGNVVIGSFKCTLKSVAKETKPAKVQEQNTVPFTSKGVERAGKILKSGESSSLEDEEMEDCSANIPEPTLESSSLDETDKGNSLDQVDLTRDTNTESSRSLKKISKRIVPSSGEQLHEAIVECVDKLQLKVRLAGGAKGRVHVTMVKEQAKEEENPMQNFQPGDKLQVYLLQEAIPKHKQALAITGRTTISECSLFPKKDLGEFRPGMTVTGFFSHFSEGSLFLVLSTDKMAKLPILNINLPATKLSYIHKHYKAGQAIIARIFKVDRVGGIELTQLATDLDIIEPGAVLNGCVVSVRASLGAFFCLPHGQQGVMGLTDVCDDFSRTATVMEGHLQSRYVSCCVVGQDKDTGLFHISTRESRLHATTAAAVADKEVMDFSELVVGSSIRGFVKTMNKYGCFVNVGRNVDGLVPSSKLPAAVQRNRKALKVGALVSVTVKAKQVAEKRLLLVLDDPEIQNASVPQKRRLSSSSEQDYVFDSTEKKAKLEPLARLSVGDGFSWNVEATPDLARQLEGPQAIHSSDDEADEQDTKHKSRKEIREERERAEAQLREKERMLVDPNREPETVDDFNRLVLVSPNSSIVWLRYMAFHLRQAEIEKARAVARRALDSIQFREEQEKLNIWTALLNLEHLYGTQDSLNNVFKQALEFNEPLKVYNHLAQIYVTADKHEEAEELYKQMLSKFKQVVDVWLSFGLFYMKSGDKDSCRTLLQRALKSLPKQEHVAVISKFAQMEFKYGDAERGKSIFDSILANYPKRTDLWLVYADMLTKQGQVDAVRKTFERATSLNLNPKKMKPLFKKWLNFEKLHGDTTSTQAVKQRAVQYVESRTPGTE